MKGDTESKLKIGEAERYFSNLFSVTGQCNASMIQTKPLESVNFNYYICNDQIEAYLKAKRHSSPGIDGLTTIDVVPRLTEWTILINTCLLVGRVPLTWHKSRTTLIPKCNSSEPADHRPLSISPLCYRALAAVLAKRLYNNVDLHPSQRGFINEDGIYQAITLVRYLASRKVPLASVDLAKAFDSVPHETLMKACQASGLNQHSLALISNVYTDATTVIQANGRRSVPIMLKRGVRQGDPLSPLLFNMVMDQVLRRLDECNIGTDLGNRRLAAVSYADDLVLCADTRNDLHNLLAIANQSLQQLGLSINLNKSFSYRVDIGLPVKMSFKYLGAHIDSTGHSRMKPEEMMEKVRMLDRAVLRGNQKLFFLRFHLLPSVYHQLVNESATGKVLEKMTGQIREVVRRWCRLPATTCNSFLHLAIRNGGLGIPDLRRTIPEMARDRLTRLKSSHVWYVKHLVRTGWYQNELTRVIKLCTQSQDSNGT